VAHYNSKKNIFCIDFLLNFASSKGHLSFSRQTGKRRKPKGLNKKITNMKKRILYVGTLIDLALIFEPDEEQESEEVFQSMLNNNNK
jgi:hypothetical protein